MSLRKKPYAAFLFILAEINLMLFTVVYTAGRYNFQMGKIIPLMLLWFTAVSVTGFVFQPALKSYIGIAVPFLGLMASMGAGAIYMDAFRLDNGIHAKDVAVKDALLYRDAAVLYFRNGRVVKECTGEYEYYDDNNRNTYYAMPYVGKEWSKNDPVTVWVTCIDSTAACLNSTGIAMISKRYRAGIEESEKKCGLKSHPDAIRITWIGPPADEIRESKKYLEIITASINGLWVIVFLIQYMRIRT